MTEHEIIISEDYIDLVVEYTNEIAEVVESSDDIYNFHYFGGEYYLLYIHKTKFASFLKQVQNRIKYSFPLPMGILNDMGYSQSGIEYLHTQPYLQLQGEGVVIAIIDTGIDYLHPCFIHANNTTKILRIWDQTIDGISPEGFNFGHEYNQNDINLALQSEKPYDIVDHQDENGHGTALAGLVAGNSYNSDYIGVAPQAELIIVKLKPAKQNFRDHWMITKEDAIVYQESDHLLAVRYVAQVASRLGKPIVINLSLGSNSGTHDNSGIGVSTAVDIANRRGVVLVNAAGNEGIAGHHTNGVLSNDTLQKTVEVKVGEKEKGFCIETWIQAPDIMSVYIRTPLNEYVEMIPKENISIQSTRFLLEKAEVIIENELTHFLNGDQVIRIKFKDPTPGIWSITLKGHVNLHQKFHMWLPLKGWIETDTLFLDANPYYTVTSPSASTDFITVGAYNHRDGSLYINSSRGPSRTENISPDIIAPGVDIEVPWPNNSYQILSATSIASAIVAGSAALLLEWGINRGNDPSMNTVKIKNYLIRGAQRNPSVSYPNNILGYGILDLYGVFEMMKI